MTYLFLLSNHSNAMFLSSVLIFHLIASTVGNPFHKYPFVFLLDVGNEEIQKTAEEQIRISVPGGSLALRYPGSTGGNFIAHVRVSGIDFGTDLKADIVEGGPGYNYVVLLFKGNPGVAYDAVVTVQTLPSDITDYIIQKANNMSDGYSKTIIVPDNSIDTPNDNAEDENGNSLGENNNQNEELTQSSSNVYNYANQQNPNRDDAVEDGYDDDIEISRSEEDTNPYDETNSDEESKSEEDSIEVENEVDNNNQEENADTPRAGPYRYVKIGLIEDESYDGEARGDLTSDGYRRYNEIKSNHGQNFQETIDDPQDQELRNSNNVKLPDEDPAEIDQTFNDEEIHNDDTDKEFNNNYSDFDEISPVES